MLLSQNFSQHFTTISRLLQVVIDDKKNNFSDGFYCECSTSLKKKKNHNIFHNSWVDKFLLAFT